RNEVIDELLKNSNFSVIKGNLSEILSIAKVSSNTKGVDVSEKDTHISIEEIVNIALSLAKEQKCIIAITGKEDIIADSKRAYIIRNGCSFMSKITGTGCMSASIIGSFIGANDDDLISTIIAISSMGIAGELAYEKTKDLGSGSFRTALIDKLSKMDENTF
ncbi:MAG: hydroxyethylthiazole kinase, partial [Erysipelotrichaceae bacterium]|nr:hydroxyethylthiazole kinase [Erysipelotrichaceae bacterium]